MSDIKHCKAIYDCCSDKEVIASFEMTSDSLHNLDLWLLGVMRQAAEIFQDAVGGCHSSYNSAQRLIDAIDSKESKDDYHATRWSRIWKAVSKYAPELWI